jgi:hypothetical protein
MLYQNYLPLNRINFKTRHLDTGGMSRAIDFKLIKSDTVGPVHNVYLEYGPAALVHTSRGDLVLHGGDQAEYARQRRELVAGVTNAHLDDVESLSDLSGFLEAEFGIVLPEQIAKKIGTFDGSQVVLGKGGKINTSQGIQLLFDSPELISELFHPELRGMLNVFARKLGTDEGFVSRIRGLYPDIPKAEFDQTVAAVKARLEFPRALLNKMQRGRNYITELRASQRV